MAQYSFKKWMKRLGIGLLGVVGMGLGCRGAIAQNLIVPDDTLGVNSSVVVPLSSNVDGIVGGATAGNNLVHSFTEFNVGEGRGAYFISPSDNIQNIFSRVTGNNLSEILGTLGTSRNADPDLWLINPNGIVFGPTARLDVTGSFIGTTAEAVSVGGFGITTLVGASDNQEILSVDNSVFWFDALSNAKIVNRSRSAINFSATPLTGDIEFRGLQVPNGRVLGLFGQDVILEGSGLNAINGSVFIGSLGNIDAINGATVQAGNINIRADRLSVKEGAQILTQFIDPRVFGSIAFSNDPRNQFFFLSPDERLQGLSAIRAGALTINAQDSIEISGTAANEAIVSRIGSGAIGLLSGGGNINLLTDRLRLQDGGRIDSTYLSFSEGNTGGGNINIDASSVALSGESANGNKQSGLFVGDSNISSSNGNILLSSDSLEISDGSRISLKARDYDFFENTPLIPSRIDITSPNILLSGVSANQSPSGLFESREFSDLKNIININSESLTLQAGASIDGQRINLSADDSVLLKDSSIIFSSEDEAEININTGRLTLQDSSTIFALGDKAKININADRLTLQNNSRFSGRVGLVVNESIVVRDSASTGSLSNVDQARDKLPTITVRDNARLTGNIDLYSDRFSLQDSAQINGQSINISANNNLVVRDNSAINIPSGSPFGRGPLEVSLRGNNVTVQDAARINGSSLELFATDALSISSNTQLSSKDGSPFGNNTHSELERIILSGRGVSLSENAIVNGDDIFISGGAVTIKDQSRVSASQEGYGISGNIAIAADRLDLLNSAQLSASVGTTGSGGDIQISAREAVNITGDPASGQPSSISATAGGPGTGGKISIETGRLALRNGSRITTDINGGGTGGSISINARDQLLVEGASNSGRQSQISAQSDLNGGEFGVLRSIRTDNQTPQNISSRLNGRIFVLTGTNGLIRSVPRSGEMAINEFSISGYDQGIPDNANIFTIANGATNGSNSLVLLLNPNVPIDGALLVGQSFEPDLEKSIQGGRILNLTGAAAEEAAMSFLSTLQSISNTKVELDSFPSPTKLALINDIKDVKDAFIEGNGEFYVVESTGDEFRIQDKTYTDTSFLDIQTGNRFLIFAVREGGNINIETSELIVRDGAEISTAFLGAAEGKAAASNLNIVADSVLLENNASISAISGTGSGGNLSIRTSGLTLNNNSALTASARDNATGGNVTINAQNGLVRTNNSSISSRSERAGGGNVTINARGIRLTGDSDIKTDVAVGGGDGGNINLAADYIIAFDDSDILANAADDTAGRGGNITLRTPGFFGNGFTLASLDADPKTLQGNRRADINATGSANGIVTVPDISFLENGLTSLSDTLIEPEQLIANSCIARTADGQGTLVSTGGGGLASNPSDELATPLSTGLVQAVSASTNVAIEGSLQEVDESIVEPTGIYQLADGRLVMGKACL